MSRVISIISDNLSIGAELNDSDTASAIYDALPISAPGSRWGEEIYFEIPVDEPLSPEATEEVEVGELGYWPPGKAFCIFFGRTPASTDEKPRAASAVNQIGKVTGDVSPLKDVPHGATIRLERA